MSDLYQANKLEQLMMLRETTKLTGALHDAQVLQLKMWPMVVFDTAISSSFTWDPDKKVVAFEVTLPKRKKKPDPKAWSERVQILNTWVQTLLGGEWIAIVTASGMPTVRGQRKIDVPAAKPDPVPGAEGK